MTMTSSTDVLTAGSVHDYDMEDTLAQDSTTEGDTSQLTEAISKTSQSYSSSSPSKHRKMNISPETQEEIDNLHENVPQVEEAFSILNKIGSGTFSSVFAARIKNTPKCKQLYALKHIIPTSHPSRIENELRCLQQIGGLDNVMGVKACLRERDHVVIVMPFFHHDRFQDYVQDLSAVEIRDYMYNLLLALRRVHEVDIIHRDVKPSNFLLNRKLRKYALVDFGLAQQAPVSQQGSGTNIKSPSYQKDENTTTGSDSMRNTRHCKTEESTSISNKKRKLDSAVDENVPLSPRKKRLVSPGLTEVDTNTPVGRITAQDESTTPKPSVLSLTKVMPIPPSKTLFNSNAYKRAEKSPRRAVLTRNVIPAGRSGVGQATMEKRTMIVQNSSGKKVYRSVMPARCACYGKFLICSVCMSRSSQHAPRAGTPGFRAPEVLLKNPHQTTAVDMWSAGVIFLSLLSGRYPFFKAPDDMTALAQIISVFGTEAMNQAALTYGKHVISQPRQPAVNLQFLCEKLRGMPDTKSKSTRSQDHLKSEHAVPDSAYELLEGLLDLNPATRLTADQALKHKYFNS